MTTLGAQDALASAELYVTERRRLGGDLVQPLSLSPLQDISLRAVAQGDVAVTADGRAHTQRPGPRVSLTTLRSLETRGLVAREPIQLGLQDERAHLTPDGHRQLAASFGRPRTPVPTAARPAVTPSRAATR